MSDAMYESKTFDEFWEHYQELHASRSVRIAHAIGTTTALLMLAKAASRRSIKLALAAPVIDYAIAQLSHRSEGIKTQPHRKPLWHARAELRLFRSTIRSFLEGRRGRRESPDDELIVLHPARTDEPTGP
jgi:hypothetical protein